MVADVAVVTDCHAFEQMRECPDSRPFADANALLHDGHVMSEMLIHEKTAFEVALKIGMAEH